MRIRPTTPTRNLLLTVAALTALQSAQPTAEAEEELLPLPRWTEDSGTYTLGGLLWPEGFNPDSLPAPLTEPGKDHVLGNPIASSVLAKRDGFLLFIPKSPLANPASQTTSPATPVDALVEVSPAFLRECEEMEPVASLLDPHGLIGETQSEDLRRLLAYHASEAGTFAHIFLLQGNEELPRPADLSRLARGRFREDHACLVAYPMGEPWRARLFLTSQLSSHVSPDYLRGILEACVQDALHSADPVEQLVQFTTQLSIRLIWLERAHPAAFKQNASDTKLPPGVSSLTEVPQFHGLAQPSFLSSIDWKKLGWLALWPAAALLVLTALLLLFLRWHRRRQRRSVWLFPDVEVTPRFGAPHAGSGGVWIRYG